MPNYTVYVTYSIDDSFSMEADSPEDAIMRVEDNLSDLTDLLPYATIAGCTLTWDDINVYDAIEED